MNILFFFKLTEICRGGGGGYNLGSGKQLLATKGSFRINKPDFQGLISELATPFPSQKADIYDIISLKIEQLFT